MMGSIFIGCISKRTIRNLFRLRMDSADVDHSENEDISMKSPSEGDKPTRGRKRGAASGQEDKAPESKAKRGRKKAANTSTEDAEEQWAEDSGLVNTTMETEDEQNSPPKRGRRGRPPKSAAAKEDTAAAGKGRRGRRKAAPPPDEDHDDEHEAEEEDEEEDGGSENIEEVKPKGRRGRKPRSAFTLIVSKAY